MAKIPFDIKFRPQIESGEYKVETQDGRPVRIVCWDKHSKDYPLVVLTSYDSGECCDVYTIDGKFYCNKKPSAYNLFLITPEPELSEFEKAVEAIYDSCNVKELAFKKKAAELLALARKEIEKDLPRWRKCADCTPKPKCSNEWIFSIDSENVTRESAIVHNGYFLPLDGLEKLPKEDEK